MSSYKVQREVRQPARLFGLKMSFFYIFAGIALLLLFALIGGEITIIKLIVIMVLLTCDYVIIMAIQKFDITKFVSVIPKIIVNK